jgi:predicted amidophosphoribosyltransferase
MSRRHVCPGPGCGRPLERWQRLCSACFRALPKDQQRAIATARVERRILDAAQLTRAAVAWLAEHNPAELTARRLGESGP